MWYGYGIMTSEVWQTMITIKREMEEEKRNVNKKTPEDEGIKNN